MYSRFVVEADARELRALLDLAGKLAGKLVYSLLLGLWTSIRALAWTVCERVRDNVERGGGLRDWR